MEKQHKLEWILDYGNDQDQGARPTQQDYFASSEPNMTIVKSSKGFLTVVADGMGGHSGGGNASVIAVTTFIREYKERVHKTETIPDALQRALVKANAAVVAANERAGEDSDMGTTLVACVLQSNKLYWISVGDSSLFLYRDGQLKKINKEHSYGAEIDMKLKAGQITPEEAHSEAKRRNMLTSYLGIERIPQIDLPQVPIELKPGEKVLLCSDGLVNAMSDAEIEFVLQEKKNAQGKCEFLTQQALKKQMPRQDNITTVLLELNQKVPEPEPVPQKNYLGIMAVVVGILLLIVILAAAFVYKGKIWPATPPEVNSTEQETSFEKEVAPSRQEQQRPAQTPQQAITKQQEQSTGQQPSPPQQQTEKQPSVQPQQGEPQTPQGISPSEGNQEPSEKLSPQTPTSQRQEGQGEEKIECNYENAQIVLKYEGLYIEEIDGQTGENTRVALRLFQNREHISKTGELDSKTCEKLEPYFQQTYRKEILEHHLTKSSVQ